MSVRTGNSVVRGLGLAFVVVALFVLALTSAVPAGEGNADNPGILPPGSNAYGQSYAEWSVAWWQWVWSLPATGHPLFDMTGESAGNGQSGHVFFLGGLLGRSGAVERTITVPCGKPLFFPVLNIHVNNIGRPVPRTIEQMYARAQQFMDSITDPYATVDGVAVNNLSAYRVVSPVYSIWLPATDNVYQTVFHINVSGTFSPAISDGLYLMLAPLSVGEHVVTFGGTAGGPPYGTTPWSLNVTYNITVEPGKK